MDKIYQSNTCGPFIITEELGSVNGRTKCKIKFINTGYESEVIKYNALNGRVADKTLHGRFSTDYDISRYDDYESHINNLLKTMHMHMMDRCYNINSDRYNAYGAIGVKVCDEWLDVNNFINTVKSVDGFDKYYMKPFMYELDKDYKQQHIPKCNRIYSPQTCMFLYYQDNINLRRIDEMRENGTASMYFGVEINAAGNYYARIKVRGVRINLGTFSNPIAAANAYNYWEIKYHDFELVPLLNDVPYMAPDEFVKYNLNVKIMMEPI